MPIVYIHGVAVRDDPTPVARALKRLREVPWPVIRANLREHVAPVLSDDPEGVPIRRAYWGDLGARFAWGGRSLISQPVDAEALGTGVTGGVQPQGEAVPVERVRRADAIREAGIRRMIGAATALRRPFEDFVPIFLGDVLTYIATRGTPQAPGAIPLRILEELETAHAAARLRSEPLVVVTHSMGGQILYDALTAFLPARPADRGVRVDYWCAIASQIGLFEELKLFLASDPAYSAEHGTVAPHPPAEHLGGWWNVWDHADLLSFRAGGIFDGVDDSPFFAAGTLASDHHKYLDNPDFYRALAARVAASLEAERSGGP
ncbi:MAG TPA: hypothetical protein VFJ94_07055 [Intrasporangium sp.]|uniref:hypothetical protein n=1 Tax=Intrasporangium sp. TaxID=1925024 RepID=UPI002D7895D9|nr:hypothetical protein [Intrasporangium sp.]HET7398264.1 hypothetical protein [Intrasporangium sp.]